MYYLFINGKMMPVPPQNTVITCESGSVYIIPAGNGDTMTSSPSPPSLLSLSFTLPAAELAVYDTGGDYDPTEYERFLYRAAECPIRLILVFCGSDGILKSDINTAAVITELSSSEDGGGGKKIKMKCRCSRSGTAAV